MSGILIFAGTADGRCLAEHLSSRGLDVHVRVATEYGAVVMEGDGVDVEVGSLGGTEGIADEVSRRGYELVVDATHPYARAVSQHIREGCAKAGVECIRLVRDGGQVPEGVIEVPDVQSAVEFLSGTTGTIFAATGAKELEAYVSVPDCRERVVARILSTKESMEKAIGLGFEGSRLICAQGPFTEEENLAALRRSNAKWMVTKDSGTLGGFEEKVRAARRAGAKLVLISRPEESGSTLAETIGIIEDKYGLAHESCGDPAEKRRVTVIGIGMGNGDLTQRAVSKLEEADLIVGAKRMLESVDTLGRDTLEEYRADVIAEYLDANPRYRRIACLMSGDTGFYSGTKQILSRFDRDVYDLDIECGISSVVYLASKVGETWQDATLTSSHGCECNIAGLVRTRRKVFTLLSGEESVLSMCRTLDEYAPGTEVIVGQDFGYPEERIDRGSPRDLLSHGFGKVCCAMVINPEPHLALPLGIPDDDFIRGDAPMTKSEIRDLSVTKLRLSPGSIVYDVGAGTGSVSVAMALIAVEGTVYAIEKEAEAADLIEENKKRFGTPNVTVVRGTAPEAMDSLPAPTHAFIGGSSGNLKSIVEHLLSKNPDIRIVINSVTIETMNETLQTIKDLGLAEEEFVNVSVARARRLGRYHLMTGQNPVYIAVVRGR